MSLMLVIPELDHLVADLDAAAAEALPPLPGLASLRLWAYAGSSEDWRAATLRFAALTTDPLPQPAAVAGWSLPNVAPATPLCIATPVHVIAGMSRVHLAPDGVLVLTADEQRELTEDFLREFGDAEQGLRWIGSEALLQAPFATAAVEPDPRTLRGKPLARIAATDPVTRQLRRFGAEVEMWLAGLALNRRREQRGQPVVNALWLWGGGLTLAHGVAQESVTVCCTDSGSAWCQGLACATGHGIHRAENWAAVSALTKAVVVLQADAATGRLPLQDWERDWFAPIVAALRAKQLPALQLTTGFYSSPIRVPAWRWPWQKTPPWWQGSQRALPSATADKR